jgi:hypothetical protein
MQTIGFAASQSRSRQRASGSLNGGSCENVRRLSPVADKQTIWACARRVIGIGRGNDVRKSSPKMSAAHRRFVCNGSKIGIDGAARLIARCIHTNRPDQVHRIQRKVSQRNFLQEPVAEAKNWLFQSSFNCLRTWSNACRTSLSEIASEKNENATVPSDTLNVRRDLGCPRRSPISR